ncbi:hypothetical protein ACTFIY_010480 [Dictyostelium cf. discoideum]
MIVRYMCKRDRDRETETDHSIEEAKVQEIKKEIIEILDIENHHPQVVVVKDNDSYPSSKSDSNRDRDSSSTSTNIRHRKTLNLPALVIKWDGIENFRFSEIKSGSRKQVDELSIKDNIVLKFSNLLQIAKEKLNLNIKLLDYGADSLLMIQFKKLIELQYVPISLKNYKILQLIILFYQSYHTISLK